MPVQNVNEKLTRIQLNPKNKNMNTKTKQTTAADSPEAPQYPKARQGHDFDNLIVRADKSAHTPGPWHTVPHSNGIAIHTKNGAHICGLPALLADSTWPNQANARLIAAAPDLLSRLRDVCSVLECLFQDGKLTGGDTDTLNRAWDSIAKAEGKH